MIRKSGRGAPGEQRPQRVVQEDEYRAEERRFEPSRPSSWSHPVSGRVGRAVARGRRPRAGARRDAVAPRTARAARRGSTRRRDRIRRAVARAVAPVESRSATPPSRSPRGARPLRPRPPDAPASRPPSRCVALPSPPADLRPHVGQPGCRALRRQHHHRADLRWIDGGPQQVRACPGLGRLDLAEHDADRDAAADRCRRVRSYTPPRPV